jgi:hypothetical protein
MIFALLLYGWIWSPATDSSTTDCFHASSSMYHDDHQRHGTVNWEVNDFFFVHS